MLKGGAYDGDLLRYDGGQMLIGSFHAPTAATTMSEISLRYSGSTAAMLTLPAGRTIPLTCFVSF